MKKYKSYIIVLLFGLVLIGIGVIIGVSAAKFEKNGVRTQCEIVDIRHDRGNDDNTHTDVYVKYTVDGKEYISKLGSYSSSWRIGDEFIILYDPENPARITYPKGNRNAQILCFSFGGAIVVFAVGFIVSGIAGKSKRKRCMRTGRKVEATVVELDVKNNTHIMGYSPAHIVCRDADGNDYEKNFLFGKGCDIAFGAKVDVYVNADNPDKYYIDVGR